MKKLLALALLVLGIPQISHACIEIMDTGWGHRFVNICDKQITIEYCVNNSDKRCGCKAEDVCIITLEPKSEQLILLPCPVLDECDVRWEVKQ